MNRLTSSFYKKNRENLCESLPNTLIIIPAHKLLQYSYDTPYSFRQESNFLYLTGIKEPDITLVINTINGNCSLLTPEKNDYQKAWDGDLNNEDIAKISGIKDISIDTQLEEIVSEAYKKGMKIGILPPSEDRIEPFGFYSNPARKILQDRIIDYKSSFQDIRKNIATLRQIKSIEEIEEIKAAIEVTSKSLMHIKENINNYNNEKEIEKELTIQFLKNGGDRHGFDPIVANEKNAATIHYKENIGKIKKESLLLLDVGAQIGDYSADISRTYQVGKTTKRQKDILNALVEVQDKIVSVVKPGITIKELQELTDKELSKIYKKLNIKSRKLPHGVSHHLGIDIHDSADYSAILEENMIITIEPGIYLPDENIGVRIEDDILITKTGMENLSLKSPY